jgi:hypothetical protein
LVHLIAVAKGQLAQKGTSKWKAPGLTIGQMSWEMLEGINALNCVELLLID